MIAAGDGVDDTDKSIWLLLVSDELDISPVLSFTASSANLAKSKRFADEGCCFRLRNDKASSSKEINR